MILCLTCKRLWPKGSEFCGCCGKSLGKRFCSEMHAVHLNAKACTVCGSRKLTSGTTVISCRLLSWLIALFLLWACWNMLLIPLASATWNWVGALFWKVASALISLLVNIAFWSLLLSPFVGEKARSMIVSFWASLLRPFINALEGLAKQVVALLLRSKKQK